MISRDLTIDLDRSRPDTLHAQARAGLIQAIRSGREGFHRGELLSASELSRQNSIHRNTLMGVMDDLVRQGYLRRVPNRGFEILDPAPERPTLLTQHFLSVTEVAEKYHLHSRSEPFPKECDIFHASDLSSVYERVPILLGLSPKDKVASLCRGRLMKPSQESEWIQVAIEHSFVPAALLPDFLSLAMEEIHTSGDFSVYRQLRRTFPDDDFFKAHYEISLLPLPPSLTPHWHSPNPPMNVLTVTYGSVGPIEATYTWFDASRAVLLAGTLEVRIL